MATKTKQSKKVNHQGKPEFFLSITVCFLMLLSSLLLSMYLLLYLIPSFTVPFTILPLIMFLFCSLCHILFHKCLIRFDCQTIEFGIYFSKKSQSKAPHFLLGGSGTLSAILVLCCLHRPSGGWPDFWSQGMQFNCRNMCSPMLMGSKKNLAFESRDLKL